MGKAGRPKADIDWNRVGEMLEAGATAEGIAATFGLSRDILYKRCQSDNNISFSTFSQQKRSKGDDSLRVKQYEVAMSGDKVMLVWLGKQRLGQADKQETKDTTDPADVHKKLIESIARMLGSDYEYAENFYNTDPELQKEISGAVN